MANWLLTKIKAWGGYKTQAIEPNCDRTVKMLRSYLSGAYDVAGITPLKTLQSSMTSGKIFHFSFEPLINAGPGWKEYKLNEIPSDVIASSQMVITDEPVKVHVSVSTCALITLHDPKRKVGASIHVHDLYGQAYRHFITLALYKMGALESNRLKDIKANLFGVQYHQGYENDQYKMVRAIKAFLRDSSIQLETEDVGRRITILFNFSDGSIKEEK